jgi:hypothetical protein
LGIAPAFYALLCRTPASFTLPATVNNPPNHCSAGERRRGQGPPFAEGTQLKSTTRKPPPALEPTALPTLWVNEIVTIDFGENVAIVTFGETVLVEGLAHERRIRARLAMSPAVLMSLAKRIERLSEQAEAMKQVKGSA